MEWYTSELEKKHALSLLWYVRNNPRMTKTDIVRIEKGGEKTKYGVLTSLIELGLITQEKDPDGRWNSEHLALTVKGAKIAEHIEAINLIMAEVCSAETDEERIPEASSSLLLKQPFTS